MSNLDKNRGNFKTRAPWFKCFPTDWLEGTRELTPEQRGVYIDCLCIIYRDDKPLPDNGADDERLLAHTLTISTRLWRSVRDALINKGKLVKTPAGLINVRAQVEIGSRANQTRTERESDAKIQKNPEVSTRAHAHSQSSESDTEKQIHKPASVEQDAAGALACLNGARFEMIETLAHWVSPYSPDRQTAKGWLESTCGIYGGETVKSAYAELKAKIAQGDVIARPIPLLNSICRRIETERKTPAAGKKSALQLIDEMELRNEF